MILSVSWSFHGDRDLLLLNYWCWQSLLLFSTLEPVEYLIADSHSLCWTCCFCLTWLKLCEIDDSAMSEIDVISYYAISEVKVLSRMLPLHAKSCLWTWLKYAYVLAYQNLSYCVDAMIFFMFLLIWVLFPCQWCDTILCIIKYDRLLDRRLPPQGPLLCVCVCVSSSMLKNLEH
jgi:hypothetical protein